MKLKIFKPALLVVTMALLVNTIVYAQNKPVVPPPPPAPTGMPKFDDGDFHLKIDTLDIKLNLHLKTLEKNLEKLNEIGPQIAMNFKKLDKNFNFNVDIVPKIDLQLNYVDKFDFNFDDNGLKKKIERGQVQEKIKTYSKSYPIDANDKLKLANQFGKITVTTWDKHEVKVDVQIKAVANDEGDAQKLLDAVQINDSKTGNLVSFKTDIAHNNNNSSWKLWNWGGSKVHKLEINYTVYMPAKTDLEIEDSYGSIFLPDLAGQTKIKASYGSIFAQNLSNASNDIRGSYGNLKVGVLNGGRLDFSYGNVDVTECNNLKADLSYGTFHLGKLTGVADVDISYVSGFKIAEITNSFKRLNINSNYSGVSLSVPDNNFDFDITTNYGGFNYHDDKTTITSKTPPDGSKHVSMTRNYKGHVGKGGSDAQVFIRTNYGGVHFN